MEEIITVSRQFILITGLISFLLGTALGICICSALWLHSISNAFKRVKK